MWFLPAHAGRMGDSPLSPTPTTRHNLRTRASAQAEQRAKRYHTSAENPWLQPGYVLPGVRPDFDLTAARAPSPSSASANLGPILDGLGGPDFAGPLLDAADANARARLARARLILLRLLHNAQRNRWGWGWRSRLTAGSAQGAMGDAGTTGGVVVVGHLPDMPLLPPRPPLGLLRGRIRGMSVRPRRASDCFFCKVLELR